MSLLFIHDHRFKLINDKIYSNGGLSDDVFKRYIDVFGEVTVAARIEKYEHYKGNLTEITSKQVKILNLYINKPKLKEEIRLADCVVIRLPSVLGVVAIKYIKKYNKPYLVEVVGCPWDSFWNHSLKGKIVAPYMFLKTRKIVREAKFVLYVTEKFLQKRYPNKNNNVVASNVLIKEIDESALLRRIEKISKCKQNRITLMTAGALNVKYKGQEYVIKAIPLLNKLGIQVRYVLVGSGDTSYLKTIVKKYGVEQQVEFVGSVTHHMIFELLESVDIYIQPSLQEGLPRAVIEAMSKACPAIGARTAGIPELIDEKWVVKRKSPKDIAVKVFEMMQDNNMESAAKQNFEKSKEYLDSVLSDRRTKFFVKLKKTFGYE